MPTKLTSDLEKPPVDAPYRDASLPREERVADLLSRMTLAEKIGQLQQTPLLNYQDRKAEYQEGLRRGRWGSRILADSAWGGDSWFGNGIADALNPETLNEIQRVAVEESRLGIPLIFGRDVIHGHATVLPIPLAQAASFDTELIEQANACVAREARAQGVHWSFAPMVDLCRDPRWGRIIEGFGEDPYLISRCGEAVVRGYQGTDPSQPDRMLACAKHFCGYGGAEGGRDYDTTEWSENTLHNQVLPPFAACVKAGVATVMTSFNDLGGSPVSGNGRLVRKWLKEEHHFSGVVVSDWGAITDLIEHGVAGDRRAAITQGFLAGIDMEMVADLVEAELALLVDEGMISIELVEDSVRRILDMKFKAGLFERPYVDPSLAGEVLRRRDHVEIAQRLAEESLVLLRNEGDILPLGAEGKRLKVAVIGPYADARRQHLGSWCLDGCRDDVVSIVEGLQRHAPHLELLLADGAFSDEMLAVASNADVAVVCVGDSPCRAGEGRSISTLELPAGQEELIESLARVNIPLVVVQCSGRPLPSRAAEAHAKAWLLAWHGGTEAGAAIARVLAGESVPSGKLPMSLLRTTGQIPYYYNRKRPGKLRQVDYYPYYRDIPNGPMFPFGFGLSYTSFQYSDLVVEAKGDPTHPVVNIEVAVTNTGSRAAVEIVQCYVGDVTAETARPERELKGFRRVHVLAGQSAHVRFTLGAEELGYVGRNGCFRVDPGEFRVGVGGSSAIPLTSSFIMREG